MFLPFLFGALILLFSQFADAAEHALLQMETDRDIASIHPREHTLGFRILVHQADGQPIRGARLKVQLQAPDTPWLGSTDFPRVEGTTLLNQEFPLHGADYSFEIVPPIRGTYTLTASVEPLPGDTSFIPTVSRWETRIDESPQRKRNLAVLLAILVAVGGISGYVIGRSPRRAAGLFILLLLWPYEPLKAHGSHDHARPRTVAGAPTNTNSQDRAIHLEIPTAEPRVGELTTVSARYHDAAGNPQPARFGLQIMQLEHEHVVFTTAISAPDGILRWQGQFFDGSPHRVSITAQPLHGQGEIVRAERDVDVTAVEPPLRSVIKSFGLLMTLTALALCLGILLGRYFGNYKGGLT